MFAYIWWTNLVGFVPHFSSVLLPVPFNTRLKVTLAVTQMARIDSFRIIRLPEGLVGIGVPKRKEGWEMEKSQLV